MKIFIIWLSLAAAVFVSGGEREILLETFKKEDAAAEREFQKAETTVEMTGSAGSVWALSETQLFRALDYKLRNTPDAAERIRILGDFHKLSREVQRIYDTPREGMGSIAGMQIYHYIAMNLQQQTEILLLDKEAEKRWRRIADAVLILNGKELKLNQGKADFEAKMYDSKVTLEIFFFPKETMTYKKRDFVILRTDRRFSVNDDFLTVYLCELKGKKMHVLKKYREKEFPTGKRFLSQKEFRRQLDKFLK